MRAGNEHEGRRSMEAMTDLAIRRSIHVNAPIERAFDVFTRGIASWWPLETHSIRGIRAGVRPQELHLELREGGRFYERTDGEDLSWGRVLTYDPPHRIVIDWHVNPANPSTEIDVTFAAEDGGTRVEVVHSGWERYDDPTYATRAEYDGEKGWTTVLGRYAEAANA
jgi:uncharacterized protein YndB with AHSA1/START domain